MDDRAFDYLVQVRMLWLGFGLKIRERESNAEAEPDVQEAFLEEFQPKRCSLGFRGS